MKNQLLPKQILRSAGPGWVFFGLLSLGGLALGAGYAALVLSTASWAEARALDGLFPYYGWHIRAFSAADWQQVRWGLGGLALALALVALGLGAGSERGRAEVQATAAELGRVGRALRTGTGGLPQRVRRRLLAGLVLLTAGRTYLSLTTPWADDGVSYEYFVRHRLLAVAAYYPLPNNHVLTNTLQWAFYQLHPTFWWSMRLPVLLTSWVASWVLFVGVRRRVGVGPAALAAGAFSCLQISLVQAASGRGYWLVSLCAGVLFAGVLELLDPAAPAAAVVWAVGVENLVLAGSRQYADSPPGPGPRQRAAWLGGVGASVVGAYAVPTALYAVASAFSWLGGQALWRRDWPLLGRVAGAGALVGAALGLLYAPLLFVSGPAALFANHYVRPLAGADFWPALPTYLWWTEGVLLGQRRVGAVGTLLGLFLIGRFYYRAATGRLAPAPARRAGAVGLPALWFAVFPYALVLGQRVLAPERTLLYKAWFFMLVGALALADWQAERRRPASQSARANADFTRLGRWLASRRALGVVVALFALSGFGLTVRLNYQARQQTADRDAVYAWLADRVPPAPALIPDLYTWALVRYTAHIEQPGRPWPVDNRPRPGVRYAYLVVRRETPSPAGSGPVVFDNAQFVIYRLP